MTLRHVQRGQPLRIPAADWNAIVDATRAHLEDQLGGGGSATAGMKQAGVVLVKNASGAAVDRFAVLGISGPIITPTDNADEFKRQVALSGVTPTSGHTGKFVVLLEPAGPGVIVRAVAAGVCVVKVNVIADAHQLAEVRSGDATKLDSGSRGTARILWKESGTGDKWAIIRIAESVPGVFAVRVEMDGGANGTKTTAASYTYTVRDLAGATLSTQITLARPRPNGAVTYQPDASGYGLAFYDGATLKLWDAGEVPQSGC